MQKMKLTATFLLLAVIVWDVIALGRTTPVDEKDKPFPAPEFTGVTDWVNTKGLKLADQKGKVVVVHFWTHGCINCVNNYPHYRAWQDKYKDSKDLLIVGVHTPEFKAEKDTDRIKTQMTKNKLTFSVAVDNDGANWKAWSNQYWPCAYLVDKLGNVRYRWDGEFGEEGYKKLTRALDALLAEEDPKGN